MLSILIAPIITFSYTDPEYLYYDKIYHAKIEREIKETTSLIQLMDLHDSLVDIEVSEYLYKLGYGKEARHLLIKAMDKYFKVKYESDL